MQPNEVHAGQGDAERCEEREVVGEVTGGTHRQQDVARPVEVSEAFIFFLALLMMEIMFMTNANWKSFTDFLLYRRYN
jgi:hypothetical protein